MEAKGHPDQGASFAGMRFAFDAKVWTTWPGKFTPAGINGKPPSEFKYSLDDATSPRSLTAVVESKKKPRSMRAIYKIEDDKLIICLGRDDRPTSFNTTDTKNLKYIAERFDSASTGPVDGK